MEAMMRRFQVLVALVVGCAFGFVANGCALAFLGLARADSPSYVTTSVMCPTTGASIAVMEYPDMSAAEISARVTAVGRYSPQGSGQFLYTEATVTVFVRDGAAFASCGGTSLIPASASAIEFTLR